MGRGIIAWLVLVLVVACWPAPARAQAGMVGQPLAVCVRPADRALTARQLFAAPERFDCRTPQRDWGPGDFDVLSAPLPAGIASNWPAHVRMASLWQDRFTLYAFYADGAIAALPTDGHVATRSIELGAILQRKLPVRGVAVVRLLWRVEGAANMRGIVLGARIARPSEAGRSNLMMGSIYAAFGGLCVALLIYNLALWCVLRHRFQLAYGVMVLALLGYAFSSSGALAWLFPAIANNDRFRINYLTLAASAVAALAFARCFFEARIFVGWLGRMVALVSALVLGSAVLIAAVAPVAVNLLDRLYAFSFVGLLVLAPPILWRAWRMRSNYLWIFAIGWAAPISLATLRVANNLGVIGWSFWLDHSTILAMAAEALLSSVAVAYRIHLLAGERDEAREQEIAARLLADTDPLTGLLNRRAFLSRAIGREGAQTLLVVDLDHFKQVNETIGHDGGDDVLRAIAHALAATCPAGGLVARIGGEEFALVADSAAMPSAHQVLDRLRGLQLPFDLAVTASIGRCTGSLARETDWKQLYRRADEALFAAKAAGRDRVRDAAPLAFAA